MRLSKWWSCVNFFFFFFIITGIRYLYNYKWRWPRWSLKALNASFFFVRIMTMSNEVLYICLTDSFFLFWVLLVMKVFIIFWLEKYFYCLLNNLSNIRRIDGLISDFKLILAAKVTTKSQAIVSIDKSFHLRYNFCGDYNRH